MKTRAILLSLIVSTLVACQRSETVSVTDDETPVEESIATRNETVEVTPPAPPSAVVDAAPHFAPEGVFFLTTGKSIETASGIVGFPAGTEVRKQPNGLFTLGQRSMALRADEVTNDLRVVGQIAGANEAAQAARATQAAAREKALRDAAIKTQMAAAAQAKARPQAAPAATPVPKPPLGSAMGASHERVKDGYVWKRNAAGEWEIVRPVR